MATGHVNTTGSQPYSHPGYTARTGKPTANATPAFGGTATVSQVTSDATGHVTGMTDRTIKIPDTAMTGATTSAAGTKGLVPAPAKGDANRYLRSDGTWQVPPNDNTTYSEATTSAAGLMSAADKTKLNGVAEGANNYTHPTTSGNKHIPSGGSSGKILRWSADGTAEWGDENAGSAIPLASFTNCAGLHNSIFRGKNLGSSVTAAQWAAIEAGTFDDLWIGDYWEIVTKNNNVIHWRIAEFDSIYSITGKHHVVIVPDEVLMATNVGVSLNDNSAYSNKRIHEVILPLMKSEHFDYAFGSEHILEYSDRIENSLDSNGIVAGFYISDVCSIEFMSEMMVFGGRVISNSSLGNTRSLSRTLWSSQLSLFRLCHSLIRAKSTSTVNDRTYWLRDSCGIGQFAVVDETFVAYDGAISEHGIRPFALIYQESV